MPNTLRTFTHFTATAGVYFSRVCLHFYHSILPCSYRRTSVPLLYFSHPFHIFPLSHCRSITSSVLLPPIPYLPSLSLSLHHFLRASPTHSISSFSLTVAPSLLPCFSLPYDMLPIFYIFCLYFITVVLFFMHLKVACLALSLSICLVLFFSF